MKTDMFEILKDICHQDAERIMAQAENARLKTLLFQMAEAADLVMNDIATSREDIRWGKLAGVVTRYRQTVQGKAT